MWHKAEWMGREKAISVLCFSLVLCPTMIHDFQIVLGMCQKRKPIRFGWDGDTLPLYLCSEKILDPLRIAGFQ